MKRAILPFILFSSLMNFPMSFSTSFAQTENITQFDEQTTYFISRNNVRVRSTPDVNGKVLGQLSLNDKVRIINPTAVYEKNFIEINIIKTYDPIVKSERYFISSEFLSPIKIDYKEFVGKYFVVVNVATETLRLYERQCPDNSCPNKMILETEVVVGQDVDHPKEEKGKGRSILGSYRIVGWSKFYQDAEGHYPAWYRAGYPELPEPDANFKDWFANKIMPKNEKGKAIGKMRGAFGWYTAIVEPEPYGQWTHGTVGWGIDKDVFIKKVKKPLINIVSDPRSSGCTRNNNEAIAFIRKMTDVGTPIIKIYAKEELLDPTLASYPNASEDWKYVMTKNTNHAVDQKDVLTSLGVTEMDLEMFWAAKLAGGSLIMDPNSPLNQVIEVGTYQRDIHPDVIKYVDGEKLGKFKRKIGRKGNIYGISENKMHGTFFIDAGILDGYAHPDEVLETSGFLDEVTPPWMHFSNLK